MFTLAPGLTRENSGSPKRELTHNKTLTIEGNKMTPKVKRRIDGDDLVALIKKHDAGEDHELQEDDS